MSHVSTKLWLRILTSIALVASLIACSSLDEQRSKTPPPPSHNNASG